MTSHSACVTPFAGCGFLPLVCNKRQRGARVKPWPALARAQWSSRPEHNGGAPAPTHGVSSTKQCWFHLLCGQCSTKIQIKTACGNWETAFNCRLHGEEGKGLSDIQKLFVEKVASMQGVGPIAVEQYWALDIAKKPIDLVLVLHNLMCELDGSQHAEESTGFGHEAGAQFMRDRAFDRAVVAAGKRLVRLHHRDVDNWHKTVHAAIVKAEQQPGEGFVYYSPAYPDWCRV